MAEDPEAKRARGCKTDAKESEDKQRVDNHRVHGERCKVLKFQQKGKDYRTSQIPLPHIHHFPRGRDSTERVARVLSLACRYSARPRKKENVSLLRQLQTLGVAQHSVCRNCRREPYEWPITE